MACFVTPDPIEGPVTPGLTGCLTQIAGHAGNDVSVPPRPDRGSHHAQLDRASQLLMKTINIAEILSPDLSFRTQARGFLQYVEEKDAADAVTVDFR